MSPCAALGRAGVVIVQVSCRPGCTRSKSKPRDREGVADVVRVNPEVVELVPHMASPQDQVMEDELEGDDNPMVRTR